MRLHPLGRFCYDFALACTYPPHLLDEVRYPVTRPERKLVDALERAALAQRNWSRAVTGETEAEYHQRRKLVWMHRADVLLWCLLCSLAANVALAVALWRR